MKNTVSETGSYCVIVTNACWPDGDINCGFVDIVSQIEDIFDDEAGGAIADCDGEGIDDDGTTTITITLPNDEYIATWPDGTEGLEWTIPEVLQQTDDDGNPVFDEYGNPVWEYNGGDICVEVEDPYGCGVTEHCVYLYIGAAPSVDPTVAVIGDAEVEYPYVDDNGSQISNQNIYMCDHVTYVFDLNEIQPGPPYADFAWTIECEDTDGYYLDLNTDYDGFVEIMNTIISEDSECDLNYVLTGVAETPCGTASQEFEVFTDPGEGDVCGIEMPNIITPRDGNSINGALVFTGLENITDAGGIAILRVFDRWGNMVFEDLDFENSSPWAGVNSRGINLAEGTYYYTLSYTLGETEFERQKPITIYRDND